MCLPSADLALPAAATSPWAGQWGPKYCHTVSHVRSDAVRAHVCTAPYDTCPPRGLAPAFSIWSETPGLLLFFHLWHLLSAPHLHSRCLSRPLLKLGTDEDCGQPRWLVGHGRTQALQEATTMPIPETRRPEPRGTVTSRTPRPGAPASHARALLPFPGL